MTYSKDTWRGKTKDKMRRERGENVPAPEPHQEENT
jgi:hypothetical protein